MSEQLNVDDFLKSQVASLTATIEPVEGKEDFVKITPWSPTGGCRCNASLVIPKNAIKSVSPNGDTHFCCGKVLKVVVVQFSEERTLDVKEVFSQMSKPTSHAHDQPHSHGAEIHLPRMMQQPFLQALSTPTIQAPSQTIGANVTDSKECCCRSSYIRYVYDSYRGYWYAASQCGPNQYYCDAINERPFSQQGQYLCY